MPDSIVITECVFGKRFVVSIEPRTIAWRSYEFRSHAEALACATALREAHGWPVTDKTGGGE